MCKLLNVIGDVGGFRDRNVGYFKRCREGFWWNLIFFYYESFKGIGNRRNEFECS